MSILSLIFNGIVAVGDILVKMDEEAEKIERKINRGKTLDESMDEVERQLLGGKTINERIYKK